MNATPPSVGVQYVKYVVAFCIKFAAALGIEIGEVIKL